MQNFKNHSRYNTAHHFVIMPLTGLLVVWPIIDFFRDEITLNQFIFNVLVGLALVLISLIARRYALLNQDRIIRVEMRQRYFELAGTSFSQKEKQLSLRQIIALRFAGDEELLALIDTAISKNLAPKDIKSAIQDWQPDNNRV